MGRYNNLCLSRSKTKEMSIQRKSTASSKHIPTVNPGASRVVAMCILGVTICSDLKMDQHITRLLSTASSTLFRHVAIERATNRHITSNRTCYHILTCVVGILQQPEQRHNRGSTLPN